MHVGVNVPIIDFRADLVGLRDFRRAAEELGYGHVRMLDHMLGADPTVPLPFPSGIDKEVLPCGASIFTRI